MSTAYQPQALLHPGEHWREIIEAQGVAQVLIARDLGISQKHLSQIVCGRAIPSVHLVIAFARLTDTPPRLLWQIQCDYLLAKALRGAASAARTARDDDERSR